jgi:peptidoglycan/LPS O-acetylase OafA/YrhL
MLLPLALFWLARALPLSDFEHSVGGAYSYGLYVYGYPIQQLLAHFRVHEHGFGIFFVTGFAIAGLCAVLSWRLIEHPALGLKNLFRQPPSPAIPA